MDKKEVKKILKENGYTVRDVEYIKNDLKRKYGLSFEARHSSGMAKFVEINKVECQCMRIIEEFGSIICIWNGNQIKIKLEDIDEFEVI